MSDGFFFFGNQGNWMRVRIDGWAMKDVSFGAFMSVSSNVPRVYGARLGWSVIVKL